MNLEKEITVKEKKLQILKERLETEIIISQLKYYEYKEEQNKLENEIYTLKEIMKKDKQKEWIYLENNWRKRIYKDES